MSCRASEYRGAGLQVIWLMIFRLYDAVKVVRIQEMKPYLEFRLSLFSWASDRR